MKFNIFSIKNFIGDLPRLLNENFNLAAEKFDFIYNETSKVLGNKSINVEANQISANNIVVTGRGDIKIIVDENGQRKEISLLKLYDKVMNTEVDNTLSSRSTLVKKNLK